MKKTAKLKNSLRKKPKQERSSALVESVLEATTRIFSTVGAAGLSTNKIAEIAGVSIGSLYQYFPGKDAIISQLIEWRMEKNVEHFAELLAANKDKDPRVVTQMIAGEVVDLFHGQKSAFIHLFREAPRINKTGDVLQRRNGMQKIFVEYYRGHKEEMRDPERLEEMVYVFCHGILGVMQAAVLEDFATQSPEKLKENLYDLAVRYLFK